MGVEATGVGSVEGVRAVCHHRTYSYGMAIWWYSYHTVGPLAGHLTVWLWYGFVLY
jgi:hypothetical protein